MEILKEEVQAIERAVAGDTLPQKRPMKAPSMAAALLTGGSHPSYSCKEVTSVEERRHTLRESGIDVTCADPMQGAVGDTTAASVSRGTPHRPS